MLSLITGGFIDEKPLTAFFDLPHWVFVLNMLSLTFLSKGITQANKMEQNAPAFRSNVPLKECKIKGKNARANSIPLAGLTQNAPRGAPDMNQRLNRSCWEDVNDTVRTAVLSCSCM